MSKLEAGRVNITTLKIPDNVFKMSTTALRDVISENRNRFMPIEGLPIDDSFGFVDPIDHYDSEIFNNMTMGSFQVFAFRRDFYKYSPERVLIEFNKLAKEAGRDPKFIPKAERDEIHREIINKMRKQSTPYTSIVHMFFDYVTKKAYVLGKGDKLIGKVLGLLEKAFGETFINIHPSHLIGQSENCTGRGFLTWLYNNLAETSTFTVTEDTEFDLMVESKICMTEDSGEEISVEGDTATEHHVTREILNKKSNSVRQMNLRLTKGSQQWVFTLKEGYLVPESVGLPMSGSKEDLITDRLSFIGQLDVYVSSLILKYLSEKDGVVDDV